VPVTASTQAGAKTPVGLFLAGLVIVVLAVETISILAGGPVDALLLYLPGIDKLLHVLGFLVVYQVCHRLVTRNVPPSRRVTWAVGAVLLALAAADEIAQGLRSIRTVALADFIASVCGVILGMCWVERKAPSVVPRIAAAMALGLAVFLTSASYYNQHHLSAAVRLGRAGDRAGARREYQLALESGVRNASLLNELGWLEVEATDGDPWRAVDYASQALSMRPNDPDIQDTYGWALYRAGRNLESLGYLERAYAAKPDMFCINYHLGAVHLALGQPEKAAGYLRRQLMFPDTVEAARARQLLTWLDGQMNSGGAR
jgi:tetratricopeptide (TPR) repeat protein